MHRWRSQAHGASVHALVGGKSTTKKYSSQLRQALTKGYFSRTCANLVWIVWVGFQLCTAYCFFSFACIIVIFDINASVVFAKSHTDWPGAFPMWHTAFKHDLCTTLSIYPMLCRYSITLQASFQYKVLILPTLGKTTKPSDRMLIIDPVQEWEQPKFTETGRVSGGTLP